jgi:hypothetical protein
MDGWLQEKDWKYLKGIRNELLQKLCARINQHSVQILTDATHTPHEKYKMLIASYDFNETPLAQQSPEPRFPGYGVNARYTESIQ